jgi:hypothetical protein
MITAAIVWGLAGAVWGLIAVCAARAAGGPAARAITRLVHRRTRDHSTAIDEAIGLLRSAQAETRTRRRAGMAALHPEHLAVPVNPAHKPDLAAWERELRYADGTPIDTLTSLYTTPSRRCP